MAKYHFICSDEPVLSKDCIATCGAPVVKLGEVNTDEDFQRVELRSLTKCGKCQANMTGRYLYIGQQVAREEIERHEEE